MTRSCTMGLERGPVCSVQYRVPLFQRSSLRTQKREAFRGTYTILHHYTPVTSHRYRIVRVAPKYRWGGI